MIIKSLLDTDLYKLTMQQFAFHFMPNYPQEAVYSLKCRSKENLLPIKEKILKEIEHFKNLKFTNDELNYLRTLNLFKEDYLEFLKTLSFKTCSIELIEKNNELSLRVKGNWKEAILFEVPCLAIIQEIYFKEKYNEEELKTVLNEGRERLNNKIELIKNSSIKFAEFGTRRRFSFNWQKEVLSTLLKETPNNLIGSSNILLAKEFGIKPIGTMAHEFFSAMQGLDFIPLELSQKYALHQWHKEYQGKLDIALTDIFKTEAFLHDLDYSTLSKYSGFRHDSGCPFSWGERLIKHFLNYKVNPKDKTFVFSDGLNIPLCIELNKTFSNRVNTVFGIGTNLTNDFSSHKSMSLVMKLVSYNNNPVIKVSDEPSKINCENPELIERTLNYLKNLKEKENTHPVINVAVDVILTYENKVLLIKRGDKTEAGFNKLALTGGYVDINETLEEAAKREVLEELGINLKKELNFKFIKDNPNRDPRKRTISGVYSYTLSKDELDKLNPSNKEVLEVLFLTKEELNKAYFAFDHYEILKEFYEKG